MAANVHFHLVQANQLLAEDDKETTHRHTANPTRLPLHLKYVRKCVLADKM